MGSAHPAVPLSGFQWKLALSWPNPGQQACWKFCICSIAGGQFAHQENVLLSKSFSLLPSSMPSLFFSSHSSFKGSDNIFTLGWMPSALLLQIDVRVFRCHNSTLAQCQDAKRFFRLSEFLNYCHHGLQQTFSLLVTIRQAKISCVALR